MPPIRTHSAKAKFHSQLRTGQGSRFSSEAVRSIKASDGAGGARGTTVVCDSDAAEVHVCVICLDEIDEGASLRTLACGHVFHEECMSKCDAALPGAGCPTCRHGAVPQRERARPDRERSLTVWNAVDRVSDPDRRASVMRGLQQNPMFGVMMGLSEEEHTKRVLTRTIRNAVSYHKWLASDIDALCVRAGDGHLERSPSSPAPMRDELEAQRAHVLDDHLIAAIERHQTFSMDDFLPGGEWHVPNAELVVRDCVFVISVVNELDHAAVAASGGGNDEPLRRSYYSLLGRLVRHLRVPCRSAEHSPQQLQRAIDASPLIAMLVIDATACLARANETNWEAFVQRLGITLPTNELVVACAMVSPSLPAELQARVARVFVSPTVCDHPLYRAVLVKAHGEEGADRVLGDLRSEVGEA